MDTINADPGTELLPRFDPDRSALLAERDRQAILDNITHGAIDTDWVYKVPGRGSITGLSVVGARQLAALYRGVRHRLLFSIEKKGPMWLVTTYPTDRREGSVQIQIFPATTDDPDFYRVVVEVEDIKTGNTLQDEKMELRLNFDSDGKPYENMHYRTIAQAKATRNAVEHLLPQDFVRMFVDNALGLKDEAGGRPESRAFAMSELDQAKNKIAAYATRFGLRLEERSLAQINAAHIEGLRMAAASGDAVAFQSALAAAGVPTLAVPGVPIAAHPATTEDAGKGRGRRRSTGKNATDAEHSPAPTTEDPETQSRLDMQPSNAATDAPATIAEDEPPAATGAEDERKDTPPAPEDDGFGEAE